MALMRSCGRSSPTFPPLIIAIQSPIYGYDPVINPRMTNAVKMVCDSLVYYFWGVVLKKSHFPRKNAGASGAEAAIFLLTGQSI